MKKSSILFLVASILFTSSNIFAQPFNRKPIDGQKRITQLLKLNDSQLKKFNELRFANQEKMIDLRAKIQKNQLKIREMAASKNITKSAAMNLVDEISSLRSTMAKQRMEMWFDVYNILDNTQKDIWVRHLGIMDKMNHGMKKGHKPMRRDCFGRRP
jgi:Spy/CpxP family protein refolding chaperone